MRRTDTGVRTETSGKTFLIGGGSSTALRGNELLQGGDVLFQAGFLVRGVVLVDHSFCRKLIKQFDDFLELSFAPFFYL